MPRPSPSLSAPTGRVEAPIVIALLLFFSLSQTASFSQSAGNPPPCGDIGTPFGDYLVDKGKVAASESYHFTPQVESLIRGQSTTRVGGDIDFMLRNYPNHHRALVAMMRLGEKEKSPKPDGASLTVDCYFERAVRFRPKDSVSRVLYANYLAKNKRETDAALQLDQAASTDADNPFTQYTVGLIYLEMGRHEKALEQAHKALKLGFSRIELSNRLKTAGHWAEPAAIAARPSSAASQ